MEMLVAFIAGTVIGAIARAASARSRYRHSWGDDLPPEIDEAWAMEWPDFTLTVEIRHSTEKSIAIFQGATRQMMDERTGQMLTRDHFVWLPKKLTKISREWRSADNRRMAELEIPEWLAKEKELI